MAFDEISFDKGKTRAELQALEKKGEELLSSEEARAEREREFVQKFCSASPAGQARIIFEVLEKKAEKNHRHPRNK